MIAGILPLHFQVLYLILRLMRLLRKTIGYAGRVPLSVACSFSETNKKKKKERKEVLGVEY